MWLNYSILQFENEDTFWAKDLIQNWKSEPFSTVVLSETNTCGLHEELFLKDKFPSIKSYCIKNNQIEFDDCDEETKFPATESKNINYWKNSLLCGSSIGNYFELDIQSSEDNCSLNKRSCGVIDTFQNVLCVENDKNCPVTSYKFQQRNDLNMFVLKDKNTSLIFSNNGTSSEILVQFKVSNSKPYVNNYFTNGEFEIFDNFYNKTLKINENRYTLLDTYDRNSFYEDNHLKEELTIFLEIKNISSPNSINLYGRSYIGLEHACLADIRLNSKIESIFENLEQISDNKLNELSPMLLISSIFRSIMLLALIIYLIIMLITGRTFTILDTEKGYEDKEGENVFYHFYLVTVACIPIELMVKYYVFSFFETVDLFRSNSCFDTELKELSTSFYWKIKFSQILLNLSFTLDFMALIPLNYMMKLLNKLENNIN